jgi:hypothetical protein
MAHHHDAATLPNGDINNAMPSKWYAIGAAKHCGIIVAQH